MVLDEVLGVVGAYIVFPVFAVGEFPGAAAVVFLVDGDDEGADEDAYEAEYDSDSHGVSFGCCVFVLPLILTGW